MLLLKVDIIKRANKNILIIDNYIDDSILKMLTKKNNREMYHLGASIKDLGKKCFGINKIEDKEIIAKIINL